jgi:hypothetical protein
MALTKQHSTEKEFAKKRTYSSAIYPAPGYDGGGVRHTLPNRRGAAFDHGSFHIDGNTTGDVGQIAVVKLARCQRFAVLRNRAAQIRRSKLLRCCLFDMKPRQQSQKRRKSRDSLWSWLRGGKNEKAQRRPTVWRPRR